MRSIERRDLKKWSENDDENEEGLSDLTFRELKDMLITRGLLVSGEKMCWLVTWFRFLSSYPMAMPLARMDLMLMLTIKIMKILLRSGFSRVSVLVLVLICFAEFMR